MLHIQGLISIHGLFTVYESHRYCGCQEGLSEGQMQRLAIARAVFSESPILLLDEVTSALDMETEKRLLSNLREMTDRTVVIVTHRPAALEICDRVIEFTEKALEDQD